MKNYYALLGVPPTATLEEIKVAYRQGAKRYHPDLNPGNANFERRFVEIKEAYNVLSNPDVRKKYDDEFAVYMRTAQGAQQQQTQQTQQTQQAQQQKQQHAKQQAEQQQAYQQAHQQQTKKQQAYQKAQQKATSDYEKSGKASDLKKIHAIQIEMVKSTAHETILKHRQRAQAEVEAFKKKTEHDFAKAKKRYEREIATLRKEIKTSKSFRGKDSFKSGYKKGTTDAQNAARITIAALKKQLAKDGVSVDSKAFSAKKTTAGDSGVAQNKIRELEQELALAVSRAENIEAHDAKQIAELESLTGELRADNERLLGERISIDKQLRNYEEELDSLYDEVDRLEIALESWREFGEKYCETDDDWENIDRLEGTQRKQASGTLYGVLNVFLNSLPEEIEASYERLCRRYEGKPWHRDRFAAIQDAYAVLSNPAKKRAYDRSIRNFI